MKRVTPAELVLQDLGVTDPRDIDVEAIAMDLGAFVQYRRLDGCEASIIGSGDKAVIYVSPDTRRERQRFSIGHELGHWRHHRGRMSECRSDDIGNYAWKITNPERVADSYAADLLLPQYLFEPRASKHSQMTLDGASDLAVTFDTSLKATAIRFVEFGPAPAMLVCHGPEGRRWFHRGRDVPEFFYPPRSIDPASFADDVLRGKVTKTGIHKVGADAWVDRWNADRFEVVEQTYSVGNDETLTMVWWQDEDQLEDALR